ncbi:Acb2/Tad1 domain-containing protein [Mycolicibacterium sp. A43C]
MTITPAELDRRFDLHSPTDQAVRDTLDSIRADFKRLAAVVIDATGQAPREQALAITHLEDSLAATIGAIVRPAPQSSINASEARARLAALDAEAAAARAAHGAQ